MLWLTWQMWILLALAFAGGVIAGWTARGQSDEVPETDAAPAAAPLPPPRPEPAPEPTPEPAPQAETPGDAVRVGAAEPVAPPAEPEPSPAASETEDGADDLTVIKGLGPKAAAALEAAGVTRIRQIAGWSEADIARYDEMINGRGRIVREEWVPQAKALTAAKG